MSSLRQVHKEAVSDEDIEALIDDGKSNKFASVTTPSRGSTYNPIILSKLIFQKVIALLASSDEGDGDITQPRGIIVVLKEIVVGLIIGAMIVFTLIFLDHRNIIHLQSAHNARNAAFQLLTDPETISNIEESADLKIINMSDYESMKKEIDTATVRIKEHEDKLSEQTKELEEKSKEIESMKDDYEKLMNDPVLGLDKFCGECTWAGKITCDQRVQFMKDNYNMRPVSAKMSAMDVPTCKKS